MMATELSPTIQTTQDDDKTGEITPQAPSRTSLMEFERQLNNVANANQQTSAATEAVPAKPAVQSPAAKVSSPSVTTTVPGRNALLVSFDFCEMMNPYNLISKQYHPRL